MRKKKTSKRSIPFKNYIIFTIMVLVVVLLTLYAKSWVEVYQENELSISPLENNVNKVNLNEIELTLNESNQMILYVGYNNSSKVYNMEKKLLKKIQSNDLKEYIIYFNVTDLKEDNKYLEVLKSKFPNIKDDIKKAPLLIYLKNGEAIEVLNSVNEKDLMKIINKYEIGE